MSDPADVMRRLREPACGNTRPLRTEAADVIQALVAERDEARRERDLAIAHDRQPYPTAHAYEKVCEALTKARQRNHELRENADAAIRAEVEARVRASEAGAERDRLREALDDQCEMNEHALKELGHLYRDWISMIEEQTYDGEPVISEALSSVIDDLGTDESRAALSASEREEGTNG